MPNFAMMTDAAIVEFLVEHIHEFTEHPAEEFPANITKGLGLGVLFILKTEAAFAIIVKRLPYAHPEPLDAQLVFLYTAHEARHLGVGSRLIEEVKRWHLDGGGMTLLCSGEQRRRFFERHGFSVIDERDDPYKMMYRPN